VDGSRRFSLDWVSKSVATVIRGLGRLTGAGTLEQVATLLVELSAIFGGFSERAQRVAAAFRDPSVGFVLVARPAVVALEDAVYFAKALRERQMRADALVLNRTHPAPEAGLAELRPLLTPELHAHVVQALSRVQEIAVEEQRRLSTLASDPELSAGPRWHLPAIAGGVSNLDQLARLSDALSE
jgi:anion-transporting  ArsA/GET3 family ATPase